MIRMMSIVLNANESKSILFQTLIFRNNQAQHYLRQQAHEAFQNADAGSTSYTLKIPGRGMLMYDLRYHVTAVHTKNNY